jgi:hypothetical protein
VRLRILIPAPSAQRPYRTILLGYNAGRTRVGCSKKGFFDLSRIEVVSAANDQMLLQATMKK